MPRSNRPWLPATPGQSAVVLTLVVLLMLNTTVLMLLVSGELSPSQTGEGQTVADASPTRLAMADTEAEPDPAAARTPGAVSGTPVSRPPVTVATSAEPVPQTTTPAPAIRVASGSELPEPAVAAEPTVAAEPIAPVQDEPPLQFFGLDLN